MIIVSVGTISLISCNSGTGVGNGSNNVSMQSFSVSHDNQADFYNNGRVVVSKVGGNGYLVKGSYRDGGLTIVLDNGKTISSGSVWGNLLETVK